MLNQTAYIMRHFQHFNLFQAFGIKQVGKNKHGVLIMPMVNTSTGDELHVGLENGCFHFQLFKKGKGGLILKGITSDCFRPVILRLVLPGWNEPLKRPSNEVAIDNVDALMFSGDPTNLELDKITYIASRWIKQVAMCREYSTLD